MIESAIDKLMKLRSRCETSARATRRWRGIAVWLSLAAGAVTADAGWSMLGAIGERDVYAMHELPAWVRAIMTAMLVIGAVMMLLRRHKPQQRLAEYARWAEIATGLEGNELINAAQLSGCDGIVAPPTTEADTLRQELSARVAGLADAAAARVDWNSLVDRRAQRFACLQAMLALTTCLVLGAVLWMTPGGLKMQLLRIADPLGDHPPVALTQLDLHEVKMNPEDHTVTLRLNVQGRPAKEARVRLADGMTLPMQRNADGSFELTLHQVSKPLELRAEAANSRTPWMTAIPAALSDGEPTTAAANGSHESNDASSNITHDGSGTGTGNGGGEKPAMMSAAVGQMFEQIASPDEKQRLTRLIEQAPREYREQVARYLLSIQEDSR